MIENERELFAAIEQFLAAMVAEGYTKEQAAARCHELVTDAWISFRHAAAVQARRNALRVVGAGDRMAAAEGRTRARGQPNLAGVPDARSAWFIIPKSQGRPLPRLPKKA